MTLDELIEALEEIKAHHPSAGMAVVEGVTETPEYNLGAVYLNDADLYADEDEDETFRR